MSVQVTKTNTVLNPESTGKQVGMFHNFPNPIIIELFKAVYVPIMWLNLKTCHTQEPS